MFSLATKVDPVAHVAGEDKDKLLKELEGCTGETYSEDSQDEKEVENKVENRAENENDVDT